MTDTRQVLPGQVGGAISPPPSKSAAHRALLCAGLAGQGTVQGILPSMDMQATIGGLKALGLSVEVTGTTAVISPVGRETSRGDNPVVDCLESGSTIRFLIPIFAALGIPATFTGQGRLPHRPMDIYQQILPPHGVTVTSPGPAALPLSIQGNLKGGDYALPGNISSQFITGLMFALPLCQEDSTIRLTTPLESAGYIDMTLDMLAKAGIVVHTTEDGWQIPGGQRYQTRDYRVEADWSQTAFLLAAAATAAGDEGLLITGVNLHSTQGDKAALEIFKQLGADIALTDKGLLCKRSRLQGISIDAAQIPDLVPPLAVAAAQAVGTTHIYNAGRLRIKECDRLSATAQCLRQLGVNVTETQDSLAIEGLAGVPFQGGVFPSFGDHRMAMSLAVAALSADSPITIQGAGCVSKSWPAFFEDFASIGGVSHGI